MQSHFKVGVVGATGMVGQQFIRLLEDHPWFQVTAVAASPRSAGQPYQKAVRNRWKMSGPIPEAVKNLIVLDAARIEELSKAVDFIFCAVDMDKAETKLLEEAYAKAEIPVISCNSANRLVSDVPMMIPELNPDHSDAIHLQRKRLGTRKGFIAAKPNCSIQSYVPVLHPLRQFGIKKVIVSNYQAISGAGKNFNDWPEMVENLIPFISGEEEKSEKEPLKIWGTVNDNGINHAESPAISAQCYRVAVSDGHTSSVAVEFERKPKKEEILELWKDFSGLPGEWNLPSAPQPFIQYLNDADRPQPKIDVDFGKGMGISVGRLREDNVLDYKFTCLSHNVIRGAAGGAVLTAEVLAKQGFLSD